VVSLEEFRALREGIERYLTGELLPFWMERAPDEEVGGFLTYFDARGEPTGETDKTFLMQIRMVWALSAAHRAGYGGGRCLELARTGVDFLLEHYWDVEHGGWFWIADRRGRPTVTSKIAYGQFFAVYAFGEYFLAGGDPRGREAMERTTAAIAARMADRERGGYLEIMSRDWSPAPGGKYGGDRKSFDVHLHAMEALTTLFEVTGEESHREELLAVIDLLRGPMLDPATGAGLMQFTYDFQPLPPIRFAVEWGSDEEPEEGAFPLDLTSYGHNVEFTWLLKRAGDLLGLPEDHFAAPIRRAVDHCLERGLDREHGGLYVDGPASSAATNRHKQFWQHAEALVGLLDAYLLFGDERYWDGFRNVHAFVFTHFVDHAGGGEWYALLERDGTPRWDYQGHAWKICYHTIRSMIETGARLSRLLEGAEARERERKQSPEPEPEI